MVADIAEPVPVAVSWNWRFENQVIGCHQILNTRRVHIQHCDHRRQLRTLIGNLIASPNLHRLVPDVPPLTRTPTFIVK